MKFILPFATIFLGLAAGFVFARLVERGILGIPPERAEALRPALQKLALLGINPVAFCGAVWSLDLSDTRTLAFPFVGLFALALGSLLGLALSRMLGLPPERAGVYVTCSSFTNIGNIGGLVVFLLIGESGFALLPFYKLFEELWYYGVLFPIARAYGEKAHPGATAAPTAGPLAGIVRVIRDPFFLVALSGIASGIGLNLAGVRRPTFYGELNGFLIPASSFILLFTIGMRIRFRVEKGHLRAAGSILAGKIVIVPACALVLSLILGLGAFQDGLGLKVVAVLASMPIGFLGLVPPALYGLDLAFANSLWLLSNAALVVIVPALSILLRAIN